ncbi:MAG: carboxypeptidase-like regulatory domain-containing protein, partial [Ignavibacteriaceae bacterium]
MKKLFTVLLCSLFQLSICYSQDRLKLYGTILSENGEPLPNANITIVDYQIGTTSDNNGNYKITIPRKYSAKKEVNVKVSFVGFKTQKLKVQLLHNENEVNFRLNEDIFESETVVVTGIASKTSKSIAEVAVSRLDASELTEKSGYQTMSQMISGKLA